MLFLTVAALLLAHLATRHGVCKLGAPFFTDALLWLVLIVLSSMASRGSASEVGGPRGNEIRERYHDSRYYYSGDGVGSGSPREDNGASRLFDSLEIGAPTSRIPDDSERNAGYIEAHTSQISDSPLDMGPCVGVVKPGEYDLAERLGKAGGHRGTRRNTSEGRDERQDARRTLPRIAETIDESALGGATGCAPLFSGSLFGAFSKVREARDSTEEADRVRNLDLPGPTESGRPDILGASKALCDEGNQYAPELADEERKILAASTYLVRDAEFPGYKMRIEHRMVLFLIFDGENWRSHSLQAFHYSEGHWGQAARLRVNFAESLTALEGLFIKLAEEEVEWDWGQVAGKILRCLRGSGAPGEAPRALRELAKKESDHTRINTSNRTYKAIWPERIADMVQTMAADLDKSRAMEELSGFFIANCVTEQPTPRGICFEDVYLDDDFRSAPRRRENN